MSIASEINRINNAKIALKTSINAKTDSQHQITNETIDDYSDFVDSIQTGGGGSDLSDYFESTISAGTASSPGWQNMIKNIPSTTTVSGTSLMYSFYNFNGTTISLIDTSNVTNMQSMFQESSNFTTIPLLDTSNVTNMGAMFKNCSSLTTIPLLDTSNVTNMSNMFQNCPNLTDTSLDNILQMCINSNVTNASRKNLAYMGFASTNYPTARIQALLHYQDFINAGWTIGY